MQSEPREHAPPESSSQAQTIQSAEAALTAAGKALEPNSLAPQDLARAATLLVEGLRSVLPALSGVNPNPKLEANARESLRALSRPRRPLESDLQHAELVLAKLIEHATGRQSLRRAVMRLRVAVGAVALTIACSIGY